MRFLFAATAALSLSACFGAPGEPLSSTRGTGRDGPVAAGKAQLFVPRLDQAQLRESAQPSAQPGEEPSLQQAAIDELALTIDYASLQAIAVADAGFARDSATAELAAIELANAAALVSQRAQEMQALSSTAGGEDCGCGGCATEPVVEGEVPAEVPGVNDAAVFSALAAEFGGEIADGLNPPSEMVCGSGCGATCEEVPGTVDEGALALAIEGALDAAEGCAAAGEVLGAL